MQAVYRTTTPIRRNADTARRMADIFHGQRMAYKMDMQAAAEANRPKRTNPAPSFDMLMGRTAEQPENGQNTTN